MKVKIKNLTASDHAAWDGYVHGHPNVNLYHLSGWKTVIEESYGHKCYYLMATAPQSSVVGILPLVHMRHFIFGNKLVSIPFFDMGGILADTPDAEQALLTEALSLGSKLKAGTIELRQTNPLQWFEDNQIEISGSQSKTNNDQQANIKGSRGQGFEDSSETRKTNLTNPTNKTNLTFVNEISDRKEPSEFHRANTTNPFNPTKLKLKIQNSKLSVGTNTNKVRMLLQLPDSSDELMKSFKSKLRSQIKRPMKEGLTAKIGGMDLLDDFYTVFCVNMRDLGSPVHSKRMAQTVLQAFPEMARIVMVYKGSTPVACSLVVGFKDTLENPWASSLREFSRLSPNMLLYWTMLAHACDNGYRFFDFGRSTPGEGTYKFKQQWGAKPQPLNWHTIFLRDELPGNDESTEKDKFGKAIYYWQKLPVPVTRFLGPKIRKHIAL